MKDGFYANVIKLSVGTGGAYVLWALAMVVVGRLYSPGYFGEGQLFISIASILSVVATGRYEAVITIPRFHFQAMLLLCFSGFLSFLCAAGVMSVFGFFSGTLSEITRIPVDILFLAPIYTLELCFYVLFYGWMVRTKKYTVAARGLVLFPLSYLIFCVMLYPFETSINKLALAIFLARGVESMYYGYYFCGDIKGYISKISWKSVWRQGKKYMDYPKYMLLGSFVDMATIHIAPFLVTAFWGIEATGYYSMAMQVLSAPSGFIAKAVGDVFRQEGARLYGENQECSAFYWKNFRVCVMYAIVVCSVAYVAVPICLPMFLGAKWGIASKYVQWMLPMISVSLVAAPLSTMYIIARRQKDYLGIQILTFLAVVVGMGGTGCQGGGIGIALTIWGTLSIVVRIISIYGGWEIAAGRCTNLFVSFL